jgi:glycosyltransferase involved in cell wall biosynthesis
MNIRYTAPFLDHSGYGNFSRNFIWELHSRGHNVQTNLVSFEKVKPAEDKVSKTCMDLQNNKIKPDINIVNLTPEHFKNYKDETTKNVGFTMFETTRISKLWVEECNKIDGIFVPCTWNVEVFKNSGVHKKIKMVSPGVSLQESEGKKYEISGIDSFQYRFYSIFQWTERKNPSGLLKAFWAAFTNNENVCLILKTYGSDTSDAQKNLIKQQIIALKKEQPLKHYPPIFLIGGLLSHDEINQLHRLGDCYVSPARAEGWGMPIADAMSFGKPIIATGFSGNMDFMTEENSYPLDYSLTVANKMPWIPWYEGDMLWAQPDIGQLIQTMQRVVDNPEEGQEKGRQARKHLVKHFNWDLCIKRFIESCEEI